jgi:FdhD protein
VSADTIRSVRRALAVSVTSVGVGEPEADEVAVEEPFAICLGTETLAVTMRTPGHDDELAAGYLHAEGITTSSVVEPSSAAIRRGTLINAACGVCSRGGIDDLLSRLTLIDDPARFEPGFLAELSQGLTRHQPIFSRTGGLHAAAIVSPSGEFRVVREDVGRHNAVDKAIGRMVLDGAVPLHGHVLVVSGRTSFEIVQKAIVARIPAVLGISAPSSMAIDLAERFGLVLGGFARGDSVKLYAGASRLAGITPGGAEGIER